MGESEAASYPTIVPMLSYEDVGAALAWLSEAFGFRETLRLTSDDGTIGHAEMQLGNGTIMLATPGPDYQSPKHHAEVCEIARRWSEVPYVIDGLHVLVDDVDDHFERAREAGATILSEPVDQSYGERVYRAADQEGHRWMFGQLLSGTG